MNGWVEDPDTPDQPVEVRVYVDGEYVQSLIADNECNTFECGCGKYHEFVDEIPYPVTEQREYAISVYAVDTESGTEVLIGEKQKTIYVDVTSPEVTNVAVSDVSETGYTVTCEVTDNMGVGRVRFFTWKVEEGMYFDGGAYPSDWETGSEYLGTIDNNHVTFRVNIPENTSGETQLYRTDIYAEDIYGRTKYVPVVASIGGSVFAPLKTITYRGHTCALYDIPLNMCDATVPWSYAKTYADSIGGYLATITSEEEWKAMKPLMEEARADTWLGASDEEELGTWKWTTGEAFSYSDWQDGYPQQRNNGDYKEYYLIVDTDTMKWYHETNPLWYKANNFIVEFEDDEESSYSIYWCKRNVTVHGGNTAYFYRSPETITVTDPEWDKYNFEAKIVVLGYIESDSVGRRYIADIPCGGGDSAGEMIRYYIPSNLITEDRISHTYGAADKEHPHRKYCDCGNSIATSDHSCQICYPDGV